MKESIHPTVYDIVAHCACGNSFNTASTKESIQVTICSACHPYCTGTQKLVDDAGRIERFEKKYKKKK